MISRLIMYVTSMGEVQQYIVMSAIVNIIWVIIALKKRFTCGELITASFKRDLKQLSQSYTPIPPL